MLPCSLFSLFSHEFDEFASMLSLALHSISDRNPSVMHEIVKHPCATHIRDECHWTHHHHHPTSTFITHTHTLFGSPDGCPTVCLPARRPVWRCHRWQCECVLPAEYAIPVCTGSRWIIATVWVALIYCVRVVFCCRIDAVALPGTLSILCWVNHARPPYDPLDHIRDDCVVRPNTKGGWDTWCTYAENKCAHNFNHNACAYV